MKESLLSSYSNYGKYIPKPLKTYNTSSNLYSITLKQNINHQKPFTTCKFDATRFEKLYLIDSGGVLIQLSINEHSFSTLKNQWLTNFEIQRDNCFNLIATNNQKQLVKVNLETKKVTKLTNLNMNKLISFEKDFLRDTLITLDYQLLLLCDLTNLKFRSLKATHNETFTYATFGPTNRFIILAVKGIEIRLVEVMNLQTTHSIKLPFTVNNLKIDVSYHSKKIAIYGDCPIIFFITYTENDQLTYELIELPFLASVKHLKFILHDSLVFLGSNHVVYGIDKLDGNSAKVYKLFNESHIRVTCFDISLDAKTLAVVSNRTVYLAKWENGLNKQMQKSSQYREVQIVKDGYKPPQPNLKKQQHIEYEDDSEEDYDSNNEDTIFLQPQITIPYNFNSSISHSIQLPPSYEQLDEPSIEVKYCVYHIVKELKIAIPRIVQLYNKEEQCMLIGLVYSFYKLLKDDNGDKCFKVSYLIFQTMLECTQEQIQRYTLIFSPQIRPIISKRLNQDFLVYFYSHLKKLFVDYFDRANWLKLIQYLIQIPSNKSNTLILIGIFSIKQLIDKSNDQGYSITHLDEELKKYISIPTIINKVENALKDESFNSNLSQKINQNHQQPKITQQQIKAERDSMMEQLLKKQQKIRLALINLREKKPL